MHRFHIVCGFRGWTLLKTYIIVSLFSGVFKTSGVIIYAINVNPEADETEKIDFNTGWGLSLAGSVLSLKAGIMFLLIGRLSGMDS